MPKNVAAKWAPGEGPGGTWTLERGGWRDLDFWRDLERDPKTATAPKFGHLNLDHFILQVAAARLV